MSRICAITGKRPRVGGRIIHKGVSKKAGGIGLQLVKVNKRRFKPNLQRIRVKLPSGQVKRMWVAAKAIKAGKVVKASFGFFCSLRLLHSMPAVSDEIRYMHRYDECIRREKVYGQKWLKLIYGSPLGKVPLWAAIKRAWFSNWYGRKMNRPESQEKISGFIKEFDLDETEFASPANSFSSFNEFFFRKLKAGARPICNEPETIAFPADGRHLGFSNLAETSSIFVKGQSFDLPGLFQSNELAKPYERGSLVISRLCPVDYHRFHFPVQGHASQPKLINGFLYSVNPLALEKKISIFWQNKRFLSFIDTKKRRVESPNF